MTPEQFCELANRLTYKPDTRLEAFSRPELPGGMVQLMLVQHKTQDAEGRHPVPSPLMFSRTLPFEHVLHFSQPSALRWLFGWVGECEAHEIKEWLRLDGRPLLEPHPELHQDQRAHLQG